MLNELKMFLATASKPNKVNALPGYIQFSLIDKCNLVCKTCYLRNGEEKLDKDKFLSVVKQLPLLTVGISGNGETLLYPDLVPLLKGLKENNKPVINLTTNGLLLEKLADDIYPYIDILSVSVDAATPETYAKVRGGQFEKVLAGIKKIVELKKRFNSQKPKIRMQFVVNQYTLHEVEKFVHLASELGANDVLYQIMTFRLGRLDYKEFLGQLTIDDLIKPFIAAKKTAKRLGIRNNCDFWIKHPEEVWQLYNDAPLKKLRVCIFPWNSLMINLNGDVYPCCRLNTFLPAKMGNIFEQNLSQIWNSEKYQKFREEIRTKKHANPICQKCPCLNFAESIKQYLFLQ